MNIIYQSVKFDARNIVSVYARSYSNKEVLFLDVDIKGKTIREWYIPLAEVTHPEKLVAGETVLYSGLTLTERDAQKRRR